MTVTPVTLPPLPGGNTTSGTGSVSDSVGSVPTDNFISRCEKLWGTARFGTDYVFGINPNAPHNGMVAISDLGRELLEECVDNDTTGISTPAGDDSGGKDHVAIDEPKVGDTIDLGRDKKVAGEALVKGGPGSPLHTFLSVAGALDAGTGMTLMLFSPYKRIGAVLGAVGSASLIASMFVD